ncbi:MFS transporter, partial [Streptomyces sp. NPDC002920]
QISGTALSIGVFFSLMISGLASSLPGTLSDGLRTHGVPAAAAEHAASLPPVSTLFATFLGNNPIQHLLASGGTLDQLSAAQRAVLTGHTFFPQLVSGPFHHGLTIVFSVAAGMALVSALASALRGGHRPTIHEDQPRTTAREQEQGQPR